MHGLIRKFSHAALPASLVAEYTGGGTSSALAEKYGCSAGKVISCLVARGCAIRGGGPGKFILPADALRRYARGERGEELASEYGTTLNTLLLRLREAGAKIKPVGRPLGLANPCARKVPVADLPGLLAAFDRGDFLRVIGDRHGITRERVRQIALEHGRRARRAGNFTTEHTEGTEIQRTL